MEGNMKYQRCYNVKGSGTKNKVARNETLPFGSGKPAEQFCRQRRREGGSFTFQDKNELVAHHCHQGKALSFRVGGRPLKLLHLRFNANPVFKINSRSSWT